MNKIFYRKAGGFTMAEVIVVIIIIGVLAALAIPNYRIQMLRVKNQEAVRILMALWEAQKDFRRDNGGYALGIGQLAVDIPVLKNFDNLAVYLDDYETCIAGPKRKLAGVRQKGIGTYSLYVLEEGRIVCQPCGGGICYKMGFQDDW